MKIKGSFVVKDVYGNILSQGQNVITNTGRRLICEWLSHKSYINQDNTIFNGKSLSSQHFVPFNQLDCYIGQRSLIDLFKSFNNNRQGNTYEVVQTDSTIYFQFKEKINLSGILFYGYFSNDSNGNFDTNLANPYFTIFTSDEPISSSVSSSSSSVNSQHWVKQKNFIMPWNNNLSDVIATNNNTILKHNYYKNCKVIRFDNTQQTNKIIENVKSMKIVYNKSDNNLNCNFILRGLGVLNGTPYYNPPCVIGLGSNDTEAKITDNSLIDNEAIKWFITKHKFVENNNNFKITYNIRINRDEGNNKQFKEIGLFFNDGQQINSGDQPNNINNLFSRGIFNTPWSKTNSDLVDVDYTITISFDNVISF